MPGLVGWAHRLPVVNATTPRTFPVVDTRWRGATRAPGAAMLRERARRPPRPELPQGAVVRRDRRTERGIRVVRQAVLHGDLFHDAADRRVVDAADPGEEMMLDLKVESPDVPRQEAI